MSLSFQLDFQSELFINYNYFPILVGFPVCRGKTPSPLYIIHTNHLSDFSLISYRTHTVGRCSPVCHAGWAYTQRQPWHTVCRARVKQSLAQFYKQSYKSYISLYIIGNFTNRNNLQLFPRQDLSIEPYMKVLGPGYQKLQPFPEPDFIKEICLSLSDFSLISYLTPYSWPLLAGLSFPAWFPVWFPGMSLRDTLSPLYIMTCQSYKSLWFQLDFLSDPYSWPLLAGLSTPPPSIHYIYKSYISLSFQLFINYKYFFSFQLDFVSDPFSWPLLAGLSCGMSLYSASAMAHCMQSKSELFHYTAFMIDYAGKLL